MDAGYGIGDFIAVLQLANKLRKDFASAPGQLKAIHADLKALSHVLIDVEDLLSNEDLSARQDEQLRENLTSCHDLLNEIAILVSENFVVAPQPANKSSKHLVKRAWKRLTWDPAEVQELRARVTSQVSLLHAFITSLCSASVLEIRNTQQSELAQRRRVDIADWFSKDDYYHQLADILKRREPGTGTWLIESENFSRWTAEDNLTMFCPGIQGSGKTMLASIVVDHLQSPARFSDDSKTSVAFVFCNFRRTAEQSAYDLLASLLRQLVLQTPAIPSVVDELYEAHKEKKTPATFADVLSCLKEVIHCFDRSFIVVDALDEGAVSKDGRNRMLGELFAMQKATRVNIFATSRPIPDVETRFNDCLKTEIRGHPEDIDAFLRSGIYGLRSFVQRNADLQKEIIDGIAGCVNGMFLLAQLYMQSLEAKTTPKAIRTALSQFRRVSQDSTDSQSAKSAEVSAAYDSCYDVTMERIKTQDRDFRDLALGVLGWISRAREPLSPDTLQTALAVELDQSEVDEENFSALEDIISVCAGLVTIDEGSEVVRLNHYTTQEYFERTWQRWFPEAEKDMAKVCLKYVVVKQLDDLCTWHLGSTMTPATWKLLSYATRHGSLHCRNSGLDKNSEAIDIVMAKVPPLGDHDVKQAIITASYFGLAGIVQTVLEIAPITPHDTDWAAKSLHMTFHGDQVDAARLLLDATANAILERPYHDSTPLQSADAYRALRCINLLVSRGADPYRIEDQWRPSCMRPTLYLWNMSYRADSESFAMI